MFAISDMPKSMQVVKGHWLAFKLDPFLDHYRCGSSALISTILKGIFENAQKTVQC